MKFLLLLAAFALMTMTVFSQIPPLETGVSQTLARWRAAHYSDVRYKLKITLEKGAPLMKGEIEIRVKLTDEGKQSDLILDWRTTQFANDKDKPYANVVAVNDAPDVLHSIVNEHIRIPKALLKTGENFIKINFASPIKTSGAAITRYVDKEDGAEYIYSLFVPSDASTAFPVFDQPDLKAKFQLNVIAPPEWKVVSNTQIQTKFEAVDASGLRGKPPIIYGKLFNSFIFEETKPISTYVFAFAAGDFEEFNESAYSKELTDFREPRIITKSRFARDVEPKASANVIQIYEEKEGSQIYVRKSQAGKFKQHAAEVFRLNREGVKFLENWFDYKFPFPKYDLVLLPEFPFGGMEHAGATFLREDRIIFPTEPTKNDFITRANLIFHEAAHQWFGDTVTMRWFDDLWLKEGFAEFMAYKTLEKVLPEYNAWKIFYERNKQAAYLTDVTRGTTPIYQEIPNLSSAKSAYGNIVYRKAPSFLKQAEFYLGEKEFQTAVRAFLKKHEFANAEWRDLVKEFETASKLDLKNWANVWVTKRGTPKINESSHIITQDKANIIIIQQKGLIEDVLRPMSFNVLIVKDNNQRESRTVFLKGIKSSGNENNEELLQVKNESPPVFLRDVALVFPNYQDYGYGIFLLDEKSRAYVLENIQNEKDDFLRSMMWGSLWDSVRFYELAPEDYVKLVVKNLNIESDESTIATLLNRVSTAMNYYLLGEQAKIFAPQIEALLIDKIKNAPTLGQRITFYRSFVSLASTENARNVLKDILDGKFKIQNLELKTKDKFDIVTKLISLGDADGLKLLADLEKQYTDDAAKRYAYAARSAVPTAENKAKFYKDFTENKELSESYIESAFGVWNTPRHSDLTLPYLEKALAELPNLKRNRKIFFVNGWLGAFIGGQKSEEALKIVNKFLAENSNLDRDLRLKILENADGLERAVKIRKIFAK